MFCLDLMILVKDVVQLLGRYADLLSALSTLPLISHAKFSGLLTATPEPSELTPDGTETREETKPEGASCMPPAWTLACLVLAKMCESTHLLDPTDKLVRRAWGEVMRTTKASKSGKGFMYEFKRLDGLLDNEDVYQVLQFVVFVSAFGGLATLGWLQLYQGPRGHSANPVRHVLRSLSGLRGLMEPQPWLLLLLVGSFVVGDWSALAKVARLRAGAALLTAAGRLLRVLGMAGIALHVRFAGPMPAFTVLQLAAGVTRGATILVRERASWRTFSDYSDVSVSIRAAVGMELVCCLLCLPCALSRKSVVMVLPLLLGPLALVLRGELVQYVTLPVVLHWVALSLTVSSIASLFAGGVGTVFIMALVFHLLNHIHKLESLRV